MSLTNCYCTVADLDAALPDQPTATDVTLKERAISAACRRIDAYTGGRQFWQDASPTTRYYYPDNPHLCYIDDLSTTTGLVVKSDIGLDGTWAVTLTINTDFFVAPENAATDYPVAPYTELRTMPFSVQWFWMSAKPTVSVTGKFGWPAIPDDIVQAAVIQSQMLYMTRQSTFGDVSFAGGGGMRLRRGLHPAAADLLDHYCLSAVG